MAAYSTNPGQRAIWAAVVGNVLEWYDFAVYGFLAGVMAKQFFPAADETTSLLASFAAFGVGFLARPLGGIVIGRLGDARGRKIALLVTIHMMVAGTVLVGLVPDYQTIGIGAPAPLDIARAPSRRRPTTEGRRQRPRSPACGKRLAEKRQEGYRCPWRVWRSLIATLTLSRQQNHARNQRLTLHPPA